ncbi:MULTISPECIES: DeoR/GlpR family DNA-binding transcription regulator [Prauserella salsuginis group]|uniref:Lactose phosphotransferase system repressor n=2 Tax=Prauserella salsuginis group TaxID=2893672 RepID=A0A839XQL5_9PSEU|nr:MULTISPECIES: DeoR/GlpR family DNA-binding transcription regulator [Prauserella salsuginis group]MBB3664239.1 DeoR/GlpR family transcriptional regulator of sugar metabolism [Prauserella sediminis]MCR3721688.1 transcriptional regulator, DeoR family [Prauserella flava]MCR3734380.1 transcriptional regulator, DeoR family [Prauserella salsuginis]
MDSASAGLLRYDDAPARRGVILEQLHTAGFLAISDLSKQLGVSDMTVRRDVRRLERDGKVRVVHGGVSLPPADQPPAFEGRVRARHEAKQRIGAHAAGLLAGSDTIAVDAGTTPYELALALPDDFAGSVVSHSVPVLQRMLSLPAARTVALGGDLNHDSQAFVGPITVDTAAQLRVKTFFLGAAAVDERGVYVATDRERPTKLALMDIADRVVLLADHSKFDAAAAVLLCPLSRLDTVVTDRRPALADLFDGAGVQLDLATS